MPKNATELQATLEAAKKTSPSLPAKLGCNLEDFQEIGSGAQGKAFLAKLPQQCYGLDAGTHVVVKEMPSSDESAVKEALILQYLTLKRVRHTVRYYDVAQIDSTIFLVESVAAGKGPWQSYYEYLEANTTTNEERINVFKQLAEAYLDWCKVGVVHKDSNFENRLVSSDGLVTLIDFGLAAVSDGKRNGCARDTFLFQLSDEPEIQELNVMVQKPTDEAVIKSYEKVLSDFPWGGGGASMESTVGS